MTPLVVVVPEKSVAPPFSRRAETPYGPAGTWREQGTLVWLQVAPGGDPRAVVVAAQEWNARGLVCLVPAVALSRLLRPGDWLVPDDYLDQTRGGPTTFFEGEGRGYIPQVPAFDPDLRSALIRALEDVVGPRHFDAGVLVGYTGPRVPTPAEARAWRLLGGDVAAPLALPLVYLARERDVPAAVLAFVERRAPQRPDLPVPPPLHLSWEPGATILKRAADALDGKGGG